MKETTPETALSKLARARKILRGHKLTKSGRNDFAHYNYFELGDFLPQSLDAIDEVGLTAAPISFSADQATLRLVDPETKEEIPITSPMSTADLKGCHAVQNLGAVQTYLRRYLWSAAMELIEGDPVDGSSPPNGGSAPKAAPKTPPRGAQREETASAEATTWQGMVEKCENWEGVAKSGKPYTLYRVTLDDGRTCTTFDKERFKQVKTWDVLQEIRLRVAPNKRSNKPDTWELLDIISKVGQEPEEEQE